jgi:hypothetical protein
MQLTIVEDNFFDKRSNLLQVCWRFCTGQLFVVEILTGDNVTYFSPFLKLLQNKLECLPLENVFSQVQCLR